MTSTDIDTSDDIAEDHRDGGRPDNWPYPHHTPLKVVLFCGGRGMRMRSQIDSTPKPMMPIGGRPMLWHIMRYYAHFGHTEFILCLGHGAASITRYFLGSAHTLMTSDLVVPYRQVTLNQTRSGGSEWRITLVDTGLDTPIGERLRRVRPMLGSEEIFLANCSDLLTNAPLDQIVGAFTAPDNLASMLAVPPNASFHVLGMHPTSAHHGTVQVSDITPVADTSLRINGGYFTLRQGVFDVLHEGEDLVGDAFPRLAAQGRLAAARHDGFWAPMDTLKEHSILEDLDRRGQAPWKLWENAARPAATAF